MATSCSPWRRGATSRCCPPPALRHPPPGRPLEPQGGGGGVLQEDPEAVRQLHREFLLAGADLMQAFTFSEDKLTNRGNTAGATIGVEKVNRDAAKLAREVRRRL